MRKRDYERLIRRAAVAYHLGSTEQASIMDEATLAIPTPDGDSPDDAWEKFCADLDEAIKTIKPTERQIAKHKRQEREEEIENAKHNLKFAQKRLEEALRS